MTRGLYICKGENYLYDLAVARAKELHPEKESSEDIRELILNDRWVREHGPTTVFASLNTFRTFTFLLDMLAKHPEIVQQLQEEITRVIGKNSFQFDHLKELKYTEAVINEALWHLTPIPLFPRQVLEDFQFQHDGQALQFQKGDVLMLFYKNMQGRSETIDPKRWMENNQPTLWAFGQGTRTCAAKGFSYEILKHFIVAMIQHGSIIAPQGEILWTTEFGGLGPNPQSLTYQMK